MAARKKTARKAAPKSSKRKKSTAKKVTAKKATAKKSTAKKSSAKKATAKKAARKATAKKAARRAAPKAARKKASRKPAAPESPAFPEIEALAELMDKHGLLEVSYISDPEGATEIHVSKVGTGAPMMAAPVAAAAPAPVAAPAPAAEAAAAPAEAAPAPAAADETLHAFKSPMVGTFYRAPSPEASPFASVGDGIDPANVVCIIEAMKVMNEIQPDIAGEIVSIEVENGEAVEFGQTLMLVRPR